MLQSGGFYSAEDADSFPTADAAEKREGAFCVWSHDEIRELLSSCANGASDTLQMADVFCFHFSVRPEGNVHIYKVQCTTVI